ncbi:MAG TPA: SdpI family protein [Chitinophagaceae bacterium]|nr:SdpI family protein [Chitinophagaceae bacterium]
MNRLGKLLIWPVFAAPAIYLGLVWKKLPDTVPLHFNIKGEPDRYGSKTELLVVMGVMLVVNILVYLLLTNIHRIDPKKKYTAENLPKMKRLAMVIACFMSVIACIIIFSTEQQAFKMSAGYILAAIGLLFSFIGNYMYSIKPNYFAGLRLPWTLEDEDNWKKTHQLAGKLWFAGGIVLAVLALLLPETVAFIVFMAGIGVLVLVPAVYSYRIYKNSKKNAA